MSDKGVKPEAELQRVKLSLNKLEAERRLAAAKIRRHDNKRSTPGFVGFSADEQRDYQNLESELSELNKKIPSLNSVLLAIEKAISEDKTVFLYEDVGYVDENGNYVITNEDEYLDMMYGDENEDVVVDTAGDRFFVDKDENQVDAHKEMGEYLRSIGIDPSKIGSSTTSTTGGPAAHQHDEFAIFRSAKMGNLGTFQKEEMIESLSVDFNLRSYTDNNDRTSLHYAADSGNEAMVAYLLSKDLDPLRKDSSNPPMTPLEIATLLHRTAAVKIMELHLKGKGIAVPAEMVDAAALMKKFAPIPPRLLISKGAPAHARRGTPQAFWGTASPESLPACSTVAFDSRDFMKNECISFFNQPENAYPNSPYSWLNPVTLKLFRTAPPESFCVQTPQCNVYSLVFALSNSQVMVKGERTPLGPCGTRPALVNHVSLHTDFRKTDDAKIIFDLTRNSLLEGKFDTAIFLSNAYGPSLVVQDTCRVKWYQKVLNPLNIIDHTTSGIVDQVYPDFFALAPVIRADLYRKAMFTTGVTLEKPWVDIKEEGLEDEYAVGIFNLLQANLKYAATCFINLASPQAVKEVLIGPNVVFCSGTSPKDVRNVVIMSHRHSKAASGDGSPYASAAICVFSLFTNITGENKLNEIARLATQKIGADVLYVTNTHGTLPDELKRGCFDECSAYATNLYMINAQFRTVSGKIEPSKVFLPFAML